MTENVISTEREPGLPTFPELPPPLAEAVHTVADRARSVASEAETEGGLPSSLVDHMREAGLFSLALPRELGGLGARPAAMVDVVAALSAADPSIGWTTLVGQTSAFLAWAAPEIAERVTERTPFPIMAGSMAPTGRGTPIPDGDGRLLSGRWPYNSGCRHADWYVLSFLDHPAEGDGRPRVLMAVLPSSEARLVDTWDVMGLRGTGSDDLIVEGVRVDDAWTFDPFAAPSAYEGPLRGWTFYSFLMAMMAGFPLGVGERALAEFTARARDRSRLGTRHRLIEDPLIQADLLRHRTGMRAARLLVDEALATVAEKAAAEGAAPPERAALVAAVQHAMRSATDTVDWAFRSVGGSAVYTAHPLQGLWRDLVAGGQHIAFGAEAEGRAARCLLGLEENLSHLV
ncbi:acyl-CoA dehydrogenase family protein [Nocardiopsis alba]|uniref:acyl-CoA dehydrogenase family protein n=1 Tax=Nocardiopsis alba TaxID=53437 RepID=UPI003671DF41